MYDLFYRRNEKERSIKEEKNVENDKCNLFFFRTEKEMWVN
jgi:hypothetical protein